MDEGTGSKLISYVGSVSEFSSSGFDHLKSSRKISVGMIIKSLDPLRAKKTFIRKKLGHTTVSAIKASSETLFIWQKEPEENTVNLQILIAVVVSKTDMSKNTKIFKNS